MVLLINCEIVRVWHILCVVALAEDLGAQALKSSAQTKAPSNKSARPPQDGRRGLRRQRERDGGCRWNWFRRKTRGIFIILSKAIFKLSSQVLTCVLLLYCCTSIDIVDDRRGKNEKYVIVTTRPEPQPKP